jgi:DNA replication protein DnaC
LVSERFASLSAALDEAERRDQEDREEHERCLAVAQANQIKRCLIPEAFAGVTLDNFTAKTPALADALEIARQYVRTFKPKDPYRQSLWFCGDLGSGKTSLACAVARALAIAGHYARYAPITEIINAGSDASLLNELRTPDLLILDWFGIATGKDKRSRDQAELLRALSGHAVRSILQDRYTTHNRPTLLITECDLSQLKLGLDRERFGPVRIVNF